ncbi:MAG: UDP-2,4-diacetamido-2,4,6-trideoxy-beta-L-altropyranose hydrolase [bacterium]
MSRVILIRVDASIEIGAGHFVRQIALAQLLIDEGFNVHFLTKTTQKKLLDQAIKEGIHIQTMDTIITLEKDAQKTVKHAKKVGAHWVVLDGYPFVTNYQQIIKSAGLKLMCVDDIAQCHFVADIVLNQNTTDSTIYSKEPYTQLLMGPEYALLRREFRQYSKQKIIKEHVSNIMITMGGADEGNFTGEILNQIKEISELKLIRFHVVLGALNTHKKLIELILSKQNLNGTIYESLSSSKMISLMEKTDLAITAAGSIVWEYIKMQVPFLSISLYDNQTVIKKCFDEYGIVNPSLNIKDNHKNLYQALLDVKVRKKIIEQYKKLNVSFLIKNILEIR